MNSDFRLLKELRELLQFRTKTLFLPFRRILENNPTDPCERDNRLVEQLKPRMRISSV